MATQMDSLNQLCSDSADKIDKSYNCIETVASKSDSSSDEERCGKTGPNKLLQNTLSPSQSQKRPMNAFLIFCKRHRSVVRQKYPHLENRSITKILGEWWAALDCDQKQKYTELARQYKEAFMKANPHFKWYKTTDLRPPTQLSPPSPPPPVSAIHCVKPPQPQPQQQQQSLSQTQTQSTPKPPKKRYLENGEFKDSAVVIPSIISNSSTVSNTNTSVGGPPILDIETANRVIENALSGHTTISNSGKSFNNEFKGIEEQTIGVGLPITYLSNNVTSVSVQSTSGNSAAKSCVTPAQQPSPVVSDSDDFDDDNDDEKPLNLSSSTVLHTSNQHIIDHFIDKLLSTGIDGNCSPSVPSVLSLPFDTSSVSSMPSSNFTPPTNNIHNIGNNNHNKQMRKDRSCKGKRYLEILNESKLGKRNRANSPIGANSDKEESLTRCNSNSLASTSKWVSGGFDLEEHIAALPQLGDTHLLSALSHSKANKAINSHKTGNNVNNHLRKTEDNARNNDGNNTSDGNASDNDNNDVTISLNSNKLDNTPKICEFTNKNKTITDDNYEANKCDDLRATQGIECDGCDGLAALAEVALQQARNSIS